MDRKSKGRQKIDMAKIENESNLQVTFSKRRSGLFKKASELSTLCGAEVAMIVFSPGNKVFSFGNPSVESVVDRFLSRNPPPNDIMDQLVEARRDVNVRDLNMHLTFVENMVESERKRGETINQIMSQASQTQSWWTTPSNQLNLQQLEQLKGTMQKLKENVTKTADQHVIEAFCPPPVPFAAPPTYFGGGVAPFDVNASGSGDSMVPHGFNYGSGLGFY